MIKKFFAFFTLTSYIIISLLSTGQDVLCVHKSGSVSFESMINSECVDLAEINSTDKSHKIKNDDKCFDIDLLKDVISSTHSVLPLSIIASNIIVNGYINYLLDNSFNYENKDKSYITYIDHEQQIEKSHLNHIRSFILTI